MTRAIIIDQFGNVEETSDREFFQRFCRAFGYAPRTRAELDAEWVEYRKQARVELEELRDRLCALASPELAAKWRAKWAAEDAVDEQRWAA